jgi:hypothetical protein
MYRDDADAGKLRIQTLEAKLREHEAGLVARDAELAELRALLARLGDRRPPRRFAGAAVWRFVAFVCTGLIAFLAGYALAPARPPPPLPGITGVPVCDVYLARMDDCFARMPPAAQAATQQSMKTMREAWQQAAQTPQGRNALQSGCTQALDALIASPMCKP